MQKDTIQWAIPALLAIGAAAGLMVYWFQTNRPAVPEPVEKVVAPEPAPRIGPLHPLPEYQASSAKPDLRPLPPLDQSDQYFKLELADLYGDALADLLIDGGIIERFVATVDSLPRSHVAERIRPVGRIGEQFVVEQRPGSGITLDPENYRRYEALVAMIAAADLDQAVDTYRRFYPLLQKAYVDLGYPGGYFNDRVVEVIDHLLETPRTGSGVALVQPHVLYEYADPSLESRSSGQKLLMRMGDENAEAIKQVLRELRSRIVEE